MTPPIPDGAVLQPTGSVQPATAASTNAPAAAPVLPAATGLTSAGKLTVLQTGIAHVLTALWLAACGAGWVHPDGTVVVAVPLVLQGIAAFIVSQYSGDRAQVHAAELAVLQAAWTGVTPPNPPA